MTRIATLSLRLTWLVIGVIALGGCGSSEEAPPPTLADINEFATQHAQDQTATQIALYATDTPSPTAIPSETATIPATATAPATASLTATIPATDTPPPTVTPTHTVPPSPTDVPTATATLSAFEHTATAYVEVAPITKTAAALQGNSTQTAEARVLPFTQTAEAIRSSTPPTATPRPEPDSPYQIVFYTDRNGSDDIYLLTRDGQERALITLPDNERDPTCAPHSDAIVYASDATGSYQLFRLELDKQLPVQLTDSEGMNFAPMFSPDGSEIAFVSTRNQGVPTIWLMNADGSNQRQITTSLGRDASPAWDPGGRQLLFAHEQTGPWDLFLTVLGEDVEGEFPVMPPQFNEGNQVFPAFDGLGERIIYTTWNDLEDPQTSDIYLLDFELPEPRPVRVEEGADIAWSWLDTDHVIASVGPPDDVQIALVNIETGEVEILSHAGTFNGGGRLCTVEHDVLPPEPTPFPSLTPAITPTPEPVTLAWEPLVLSPELRAAQGRQHIVQPGDTLMHIGYTYGINWTELVAINELSNPDRLRIGQSLTIPITRKVRQWGSYVPADLNWDEVDPYVRKEIVVDIDKQRVTALENGRVVRTVTVSTGAKDTPTVTGEYSIYWKREKQTLSGADYYLPDVPYIMYFYEGYGLHGAYWHDDFGKPVSHGCVNLPPQEAKWFYYWAEIGTPVLVQETSLD